MTPTFLRRLGRSMASAVIVAAAVVGLQAGPAHAGNFVAENGGDFDCDGVRDSVVANGSDTVDGTPGAGSVTVQFSQASPMRITQDTPGVPGSVEAGDIFGAAHTTYDRDGDGCDDLVIGVPGEDIGSDENAGMIVVISGSSAGGLATARSQGYHQDSTGFPGVVEPGDRFGETLSAGVTHAGMPFLLVGSPGESIYWRQNAGMAHYVRPDGITSIHQDSPGVGGAAERDDAFGLRIAASPHHFAISAPQEDLGEGAEGMVHVFRHPVGSGRPDSLATIHQDTSGISGGAEFEDQFGIGLSILGYRPNSSSAVGALVAVGTPSEDIGTVKDAGMAHLLHVPAGGGVSQLTSVTQNTSGVSGVPEAWEEMGYDTVLANLDPDAAVATPQTAAWAVSVPGEETASGKFSGAHVFRPGWQRGDSDVWAEDGSHGLPDGSLPHFGILRADPTYLHLGMRGNEPRCHAVPWANLLEGAGDPVILRDDSCM